MSYLSDAEFIYRTEYTTDKLGDHTERDHTLMARMAKRKGLGGADFQYPVRTGNPQGVSGLFASAQSAVAKSKGEKFVVEPKLKYGIVQLDGPSLQRAEGNKTAFYDLLTMEADGILEELGDSTAFDTYRSGNGMRGRRSSASTNVITLTRADDVRNFKRDMTVIADDTITGASPRSGSTTVTAMDEDGATITLASAAAISGFLDNDYLFRLGDPGTCVDGLELFVPLTAPTSGDSFRSVDRSVDVRGLAGSRVNDTASYPEENIGLAAIKIANNGKKADCAYINPINHWAIAKRLNAKVEYESGGRDAEMYFQYIVIHTPAGAIKLYSDPDCPIDRAFVGNMDWFFYRYVGDAFTQTLIHDGGKRWLRQYNADGIESRFLVHSNTMMPLPATWAVVAI